MATLRILPRSGRIAWRSRSRACLAEPPAESPSTMKISVPCLVPRLQSASLPGSRSLRVADWRPISFSRFLLSRSSAWSTAQSSSLVACWGESASQWSKASRTVLSTMRVASWVASRSLVWPWNSGSRMNTESMAAAVPSTSSAVICAGAAVADALAEVAQRLAERRAEAVLVRAALGRRDGVAVGVEEAVLVGDPAHRPLDRAVPALLVDAAGEDVLGDARLAVDGGFQVLLEAAGEMEARLRRRVVGDERLGARPADLDAAEQVGLGARHAQEARRLEGGALAEDLLVGLEADLGAAPVLDGAELLQLALRRAAAEGHGVELLAARDLDLELLGERVDDGYADAVQAAGGVVDLGVELAARVQRGHDHFEGGLRS